MTTIDVTNKVPKEGKEMVDAIVTLINNAKAKKPIQVIVLEELPALMTAVEGYDKIGEEVKQGSPELAAYAVQQILSAFLPKAA